jgi:hypothetical protein
MPNMSKVVGVRWFTAVRHPATQSYNRHSAHSCGIDNFGMSIQSPLQRRRLCDHRTVLPPAEEPYEQFRSPWRLLRGCLKEGSPKHDKATQTRCVTAGHAVKAMVLNGRVRQPTALPGVFQKPSPPCPRHWASRPIPCVPWYAAIWLTAQTAFCRHRVGASTSASR